MLQKFASKLTSLTTVFLLLSGAAHAKSGWDEINMTSGVTAVSRSIYDLHMLGFWVCVAIGIVVFGVMIYSMVAFRHSKGAVPDTTLIHSTKVEVIWTIIPILILVGLAIPAARSLIKLSNVSGSQLTIKVTGYQWGWNYTYLQSGVNFFSKLDARSNAARQLDSGISPYSVPHYLRNVDHPLVVPVDTKVLLLITSDDVIHSWWVPALGVKKDAIPGYINESFFKVLPGKLGTYRGQCSELCGRGHAFMPIVVDVRSKADFAAWLKAQQAAEKSPTASAAPKTAAVAAARPAAG
ncbi:MAG: cytochrome c oxidase subunit II [Steroidobacteraceae bacterium]